MVQLLKSKRTIIIASVLATLIIIGIWVGYYLHSPNGMIALDVNPSIEIYTNHLGQVESVDAVNDDAKQVMAGYQLTDRNLETVIGNIVDRLILNGYLTTTDTNEILLSSNQSDASDALLSKANTAITNYLQEKQLEVGVVQQKVDMDNEAIKEAHENHISTGKMALIKKLMKLSDEYTFDELKSATVKQLMTYFADQKVGTNDLEQKYALVTSAPVLAEKDQEDTADTTSDGAIVSITPAVNGDNDYSAENDKEIESSKGDLSDKAASKIKIIVKNNKTSDQHDAENEDNDYNQNEDNGNNVEETDTENDDSDKATTDSKHKEDSYYDDNDYNDENGDNEDADYEESDNNEINDTNHEYNQDQNDNEDSQGDNEDGGHHSQWGNHDNNEDD